MNHQNIERFDLSINALKEIRELLEARTGRDVDCMNDRANSRYRFADREFNSITVGTLSFNYETGEYDEIEYNPRYDSLLEAALEEKFDFNKIKDLVLLSWANYTMNLITEIAYEKDDGIIRDLRDKLYTNYYIPIKMDEFNYSDALSSNPSNAKDNLIRSYHENLREDIKMFNDELDEAYELVNTPYAKAIVVLDGKVVDDPNVEVSKKNEIVTYVSSDYQIYVPFRLVEGIELDEVEDKITYRGETYINSSYINEYE